MKAPRLKWPSSYSLARSDDARFLACLGRNVVVIDMHERVRVSTSHPLSHPSHASFSPNGEQLAVKSTSGKIVILDPKSGSVTRDFNNQKEGEGSGVYFSSDGNELIDGSWDGFITIRHTNDGAIVMRQQHKGEMISNVSHDLARRLWLVQHSPKVRQGENWPQPGYLSLHGLKRPGFSGGGFV